MTSRLAGVAALAAAALGACGSGNDAEESPPSVAHSSQSVPDDDEPPAETGSVPTPTRPTTDSNASRPTLPSSATLPPIADRPTTSATGTEIGSDPDDQLSAAISDLADRTGVDASDIEVVRDEAVVWSDGSIGCPRPGMNYTQALVRGRLVVLRAGGSDHEYHAGGRTALFWCPSHLATPPASGAT